MADIRGAKNVDQPILRLRRKILAVRRLRAFQRGDPVGDWQGKRIRRPAPANPASPRTARPAGSPRRRDGAARLSISAAAICLQ